MGCSGSRFFVGPFAILTGLEHTHARTHARMHEGTRARANARTHTRTHCTHVRMHARMHAHMHVRMHACTHAQTHGWPCVCARASTHARTRTGAHARRQAPFAMMGGRSAGLSFGPCQRRTRRAKTPPKVARRAFRCVSDGVDPRRSPLTCSDIGMGPRRSPRHAPMHHKKTCSAWH